MPLVERRLGPPLGDLLHRCWHPGPGDPLAPWVESVADCEGRVLHRRERVFPHGALEIVVHLDEPYRRATPAGPVPYAEVCLSGIHTGPVLMEAPATATRAVGIRLTPWGARLLLRRPLTDLGGATADLSDLMPDGVNELAGRCHEATDGPGRIAAVRRWLEARLPGDREPGQPAEWVAAQIARNRGAVDIGRLREATGRSWPRFETEFRDLTGVTPKRYARLHRFRHAAALAASSRLSLSVLAVSAGYADQAHMTREFRALAGVTPRDFRSRPRYPGAVSMPDERNLQDGPDRAR